MSTFAAIFVASLDAARAANARLADAAPAARELGDTGLIEAQRAVAEARRFLDACAAVLAGEVVRRSGRDAGLGGLAKKEGFRTPEGLIRHTTGSSAREASTLVRAGSMINDAELATREGETATEASALAEPWLVCVGGGRGR